MPLLSGDKVISLKINRRGVHTDRIKKFTRKYSDIVENELYKIAKKIGAHFSMVINRDRKRKTTHQKGGLASAFTQDNMINISRRGQNVSVRIGDKNYLNDKYPYWRVINNGGYIPQANLGFFGHFKRPDKNFAGTGVGTEVWHGLTDTQYTWDRAYFIQPKNPVPALNYIGKTKVFVNTNWNSKWKIDLYNKLKKKDNL